MIFAQVLPHSHARITKDRRVDPHAGQKGKVEDVLIRYNRSVMGRSDAQGR